MNDSDPFAVLGLEPTVDPRAVKRAYFSALQKSPPHADPEGFRKVRAAYDALTNDDDRVLAWLRSPTDTRAELAHWESRYRQRIDRATDKARREHQRAQAFESFIEAVDSTTLDELCRSAGV